MPISLLATIQHSHYRQFNPPQSAFPSYSFDPPRPSRRAIQRRVQRSIPQGLASALIAIVLTVNVPSSSDAFSDVPQTLSGADKIVRIQKPKSKQAESCTRKCVGTCIRGGAGAPGEGPLNIRRPLVVFKNGFRSRQYCLIECSDICNLIKMGTMDHKIKVRCPRKFFAILRGKDIQVKCLRILPLPFQKSWFSSV